MESFCRSRCFFPLHVAASSDWTCCGKDGRPIWTETGDAPRMLLVMSGAFFIQFNTDSLAILRLFRISHCHRHCGYWLGYEYDDYPLLVQGEKRTPNRNHLVWDWDRDFVLCPRDAISH